MSLLRRVVNNTPVPYVSGRQSNGLSFAAPVKSTRSHALAAMGGNGTLFAIVDATSQGTASAHWRLYRKAKSGKAEDRVEVTAHAALDLWRKPNQFFTQQELIETGQQHNDLTGEMWWVIARSPRSAIPLELWPVRPDRMEPVPSATNYLQGYIYKGPDGEDVPLALDEVILIRRPHPEDPYRGIGPVQAILTDLDAARYSAEWNKRFFENSAEPGGIIQVDRRLTDDEWRDMRSRWQEQHQGVNNAHRVALLENAQWIDRKFTQRDMQFAELRNVSDELIRKAFRFPVPMLGTSENVNRANADAAEVVFGRWLLVPRLDRIKQALNNDLLPLFYPVGTPDSAIDVEFDYDYDTVVPADKEGDAAALAAKVTAAVALIGAGFDAMETMEALQLPTLSYTKPAPPPAPAPPSQGDGGAAGEGGVSPDNGGQPPSPPSNLLLPGSPDDRITIILRNSLWHPPLKDAELGPAEPDLGKMQSDWDTTLDKLMGDFTEVNQSWNDILVRQVREMAASGSLLHLLDLPNKLDASQGASLLEQAMIALGQGAAHQVEREAKEQGVTAHPAYPRRGDISVMAQVVMAQLAAEVALSAGREALRIGGSATTPDEVSDGVKTHLESLTDARPRLNFGGALSAAQRQGRVGTLLAAPQAAYYATEILDKNTCKFCRAVNRRWLGNTMQEAQKLYPVNGYVDCQGGVRCRGTIVAVWRPEQQEDFNQ